MSWTFVGPILLSGIGQVMNKYAKLFNAKYITFNDDFQQSDENNVFAFIIPQKSNFEGIVKKFNPKIVMTVCETEPVHEDYGLIFDTFPLVLVPSEFCKNVFLKQFPHAHIEVFRHWAFPLTPPKISNKEHPYTFYTIGNAIDPRKNINMLLRAFVSCEFENARLVIKATCLKDINLKVPNVLVLNGLMTDEQIDRIHDSCDCYINCSFSEGVGMGAVEAALKNKPVIITDYGGLKEYVNTPFIVSTTEANVGFYDFLYEPHMKWGNPSFEDLVKHMKFCYKNNIRTWNHEHTVQVTSGSMLRAKFSNLSLALTGSPIEITSLTNNDTHSGAVGDWVFV